MIVPISALSAAKSAAVLLLAFGPYLQTPAADEGQNLRHDVVVTATRLETPAREVAGSFTVLLKTALERSRRTTVFDALETAPGLTLVRNGGPGGISSVFVRGANSEHVLVTFDGVPLNDPINPSRSFDFAHLGLEGVDRIEVLRGPQSPLYGSDAVGGAVHILTARGRGRPRLSLRASAGSYRTLDGSADFRGSSGPFHYAFALSRSATEGLSAASAAYPGNEERDGDRRTAFAARLGFVFKSRTELDFTLRAVAARTDLDNFGGAWGDDPNHIQDYRSGLARLQVRILHAGGFWEQKVSLAAAWAKRTNDNPADPVHPYDSERGSYQSSRLRLDWQNNLFLGAAQTLTLGLDAEREAGESAYRSDSLWGPSESVFPLRASGRAGIFLQDQIKVGQRLFLAAGLRLDRHDRAGGALTYRLSPAFLVEETGTKLKATIGTGFKAPSLYQLYAPGTAWGPIGNPGLKTERSLGWDAGFEQAVWGGRAEFGLVYFRNELENLVDFDFARGYINIGRARTHGLEASAAARLEDGFDLRFSYTRLEARDLAAGTPLPRRPKDRFASEVQWAFARRFDAGLSAVYTGPRPDRDYASWPALPVTLAGFWLLGANASLDLGGGARLFLRLDNLLDVRYETVFGYGSPRFAAYGGLRLGL